MRHGDLTGIAEQDQENDPAMYSCMRQIQIAFGYIAVVVLFPWSLCMMYKVVHQYERGLVIRVGFFRPGIKEPGLVLLIPCIDRLVKIDMRVRCWYAQPQNVVTKDALQLHVQAIIFGRVNADLTHLFFTMDIDGAAQALAMAGIRAVFGQKNFEEILNTRQALSADVSSFLRQKMDVGIDIFCCEVTNITLPVDLQRAMAAQAEATQEAKAKKIDAAGELKASEALRAAAEELRVSPAAMQVRYLQTLNAISTDRNSTIFFPIPIDVSEPFILM